MRCIVLLLLFFASAFGPVQANENPGTYKSSFVEWNQKPLDLLSLFLPANPVILQVGKDENKIIDFAKRWPDSTAISYDPGLNPAEPLLDTWCRKNKINRIDLICLDLQGSKFQILENAKKTLMNARCVAVHIASFPFQHQRVSPLELKMFFERCEFRLVANWRSEGKGEDFVFVKNDYFVNDCTKSFLKNNTIDRKYKRYLEPYFKVYYDIEDDTADSIKNTLKNGYAYEGNIGLIIDKLTRPGSLALDVGAHIGMHTVNMSRKVGPQGAVIAFEPNKKLYMELLDTLAINKCSNVIPISRALGDSEKRVVLNNIRIEQGPIQDGVGDLIETTRLDSLNIDNLSIIKMDIENYEYFALKGAQNTILKNRPVIIFECWIDADYKRSEPKKKANFDRVISLIESLGYEIYVIYCNDFIAFPIEATGELENYKKNFKKLDLNNFDLGLR
jgi:FkbM family methyltransferase